jgi:heme/copper-type cytochrome/quinol oxidase subunit 3
MDYKHMNSKSVLGMTIFIASEAVFFAVLILAFVFYRDSPFNKGLPNDFNSLDVGVTAFFSVALYASSLTNWLSGRAHRRGDIQRWRLWLVVTILLGLTFIVGEITEYYHLITVESLAPNTDVFGSTFYAMTGFHGFHVFIGLVLLTIMLVLTFKARDHYAAGKHDGAVEAISIYWHFVDAVWVVIFPTVYLWSLAGPSWATTGH